MGLRRKKPPFVYLVWEDIAPHEGSWVERKKVKPAPAIMESVGWLVRNDDKYVILAQDIDYKDDMVAGLATYPKGCVISLDYLGEPNGKESNREGQDAGSAE